MRDTKHALQVEGGADLRRLLGDAHEAIADRSVHLDRTRAFQGYIGDGLGVDMSIEMWYNEIDGKLTSQKVRIKGQATRLQMIAVLDMEIEATNYELVQLADIIHEAAIGLRTGHGVTLSTDDAGLVGWKVPEPDPSEEEATNPHIEIETEEAE